MADRSGCYLYAIGRGIDEEEIAVTPGLRAAPLRVVEHRGLAAVVSDVDLDEFGEDGLRRNLEDLHWLEDVARAHDAVVRAATAVGPTAPLRLATVCFDDDQVRSRMDQWHDPLVRALDRVDGRVEFSVKAYAAQPEPAGQAAPPATGPGAGAAYLQRRREETLRREQAGQDAAHDAEELYTVLGEHAVARRRLQPQDPRLARHEGTMVLNAAYLVDADEPFADTAEGAASRWAGLQVEVNGPWPPYSFATLEEQ
ncbi:MAG TPA: GvpL/GvpF family gas vesicle protein [Nocardioidaceae bacterium]|nr:GvpL/GvpF family gas vesicle protein [Nocardioidaceae bacterium]